MLNYIYSRNIIFYGIIFYVFLNITYKYILYYENRGCNDTKSYIVFIDVGQGDAIYINDKQKTLIDTGNIDSNIINKLKTITKCEKIIIDNLILTHQDIDHIGEAKFLIQKNIIKKVWHNGFLDKKYDNKKESYIENELENIIQENKIITEIININKSSIENINFIYPEYYNDKISSNENSMVLKYDNGNNNVLLTGDIGEKTENILLNTNPYILKSKIYKLGHHGSRYSNNIEFMKMINAEIYIVSASKDNKYNHPHKEVFDRINAINALQSKKPEVQILQTFLHKDIKIEL